MVVCGNREIPQCIVDPDLAAFPVLYLAHFIGCWPL